MLKNVFNYFYKIEALHKTIVSTKHSLASNTYTHNINSNQEWFLIGGGRHKAISLPSRHFVLQYNIFYLIIKFKPTNIATFPLPLGKKLKPPLVRTCCTTPDFSKQGHVNDEFDKTLTLPPLYLRFHGKVRLVNLANN